MGKALVGEAFAEASALAEFKIAVIEWQHKAFVDLGHAREKRLGPRWG